MNPNLASLEETYRRYFPIVRERCLRLLGDGRRLEVQLALGTTAELTQRVRIGAVSALGIPEEPLHLRWVPLSAAATIRFYINRRLSIAVEGNQHWVAFEKERLPSERRIDFTG